MAVTSAQIYTWLERYAGIVAEQKQYLTGLDAAFGAAPEQWPAKRD